MTEAAPLAALSVGRLSATLSDKDRRFVLSVEDFSAAPGEAVAITGQSGSGKTLFLEMMGLLRRPDPGGAYRVDPEPDNLAQLWAGAKERTRLPEIRARRFGIVPQVGGLLPFLTARQNIALSQRIGAAGDAERVGYLLDRLDIERIADLYPSKLSIGERQRVAIARALAHCPRVILADEPTAALDPENAIRAMTLFLEAAQEAGVALILSCHDMRLVEHFDLTQWHLCAGAEAQTVTSTLWRREAHAA